MRLFAGIKTFRLNCKASAAESRPEEILSHLQLKEGNSIADIGSGGGYYSVRFAEKVGPAGGVYALDNNPFFLKKIKKTADKKNLNIQPVSKPEELPEKGLDLIFFRNSAHHIENRTEYFRSLRKYLRDKGRIAVIEYREDSFSRKGHSVSKNQLSYEMKEAGYRIIEDYGFLPEQSFTVYLADCRKGI